MQEELELSPASVLEECEEQRDESALNATVPDPQASQSSRDQSSSVLTAALPLPPPPPPPAEEPISAPPAQLDAQPLDASLGMPPFHLLVHRYIRYSVYLVL